MAYLVHRYAFINLLTILAPFARGFISPRVGHGEDPDLQANI